MKRGFFIPIGICLFQCSIGCSLFQKTRSSSLRSAMKTKEESTKSVQLKTMYQRVGWSLSSIDDSLNSSSTVVIWPKGEFSFSPLGGFSGMAEKVMISGQLKSGHKAVEEKIQVAEQHQAAQLKEEQGKVVDGSRKETIKERFPVSGWWWCVIIIPILFALRWAYNNYQFFFGQSKI